MEESQKLIKILVTEKNLNLKCRGFTGHILDYGTKLEIIKIQFFTQFFHREILSQVQQYKKQKQKHK
jgi:hypothetical protein